MGEVGPKYESIATCRTSTTSFTPKPQILRYNSAAPDVPDVQNLTRQTKNLLALHCTDDLLLSSRDLQGGVHDPPRPHPDDEEAL